MPLGVPAIEERPHGDRPVTIEPRPYQFLRAGGPQPLLVRLNVNVLVVVDLRRDEHPLEPGQWIADDPVAEGGGINVTRFDPLMARPAWVSRCTQTDWHARAGAQRRHQLQHWSRIGEVAGLLYVDSRVAVALVDVGISVALEIGEPQPSAVRRTPHLVLLMKCPFERPVDRPRPLDGLNQLGARAAHHQADGILAVSAGMRPELAENAVSFAAAASAAEENLEHRARQQPHLGSVAAR